MAGLLILESDNGRHYGVRSDAIHAIYGSQTPSGEASYVVVEWPEGRVALPKRVTLADALATWHTSLKMPAHAIGWLCEGVDLENAVMAAQRNQSWNVADGTETKNV